MTTYAIGDLQGCYDELRRLLDRLAFDPARDRLWFVGDLVNRGPDSLAVLRFVRDLGQTARVVLGNHDLHLLALDAGLRRGGKPAKPGTLREVLRAPDREELLDWLRRQPLLHQDPELDCAMVHAGLPPQWDLPLARACAAELEAVLASDDYRAFLHEMYGDQPARWSPELSGMARLRFITNCLTRMRFCTVDGALDLAGKGDPGDQAPGLLPWFEVPSRRSREARIIFGHWSTLGYLHTDNVWAIDSGCLWGGALTALALAPNAAPTPIQIPCAGYRRPG